MRVFRLFATCIPVRGYTRSTICDVQKGAYFLVPNSLLEFIEAGCPKTGEFGDFAKEYMSFLLTNHLGRYFSRPENFVPLSRKYSFPGDISNCIISVSPLTTKYFNIIVGELTSLGCKHLQVRFNKEVGLEELEQVCESCENTTISSIEVFIPFSKQWSQDGLSDDVLANCFKLASLVVYNSPSSGVMNANLPTNRIVHVKQKSIASEYCGNISPDYFEVNIEHFMESLNYNSCLYKKVAIDKNGEIRNCLSMTKSYGNIMDNKLREIVSTEEFQSLWGITKNSITKCKDCEFRHICSDCRAFLEDPSNMYSKPLKCGYDPYSGKWARWKTKPSNLNSINYYELMQS